MMSSQNRPNSLLDSLKMQHTKIAIEDTEQQVNNISPDSIGKSPVSFAFWRDRLVEAGLILSMALYYVVGNKNLQHVPVLSSVFSHLTPIPSLLSLPFLLIFALLCWYRLPVAVALLPLSLPYYLIQKNVASHYNFSLVEITLWTCIAVALLQMLVQRGRWPYWLSWSELHDDLGPFILPILVFTSIAAFSIVIAYAHMTALRAFREEVFDPLLYLLLVLACLRTRQDMLRLLGSLMTTGFIIALMSIVQYFFFKHTLVLEADGIRRVHTVYGSANSIGLLFDYTLPVALAWLLGRVPWRSRVLALLICIPTVIALYLTQSHGAWIALFVAALFVAALSVPSRSYLLVGGGVLLLVVAILLFAFHDRLLYFLLEGHTNGHVSTLTKRIYLWETALRMIHDRPWFGFGMDNWLCYYSLNNICNAHQFHYWIVSYPPHTGIDTGLREEPTLSHPHNIFLQIWVSMGIFALLAFIAVLVLFYRLFIRLLPRLRALQPEVGEQARWMTIGVGGAMLAALVQGMVDSSFLEQDLAFCFWILVVALLLIRRKAGITWRDDRKKSMSQ
jgi:putative inorganic carbon (HCO3(-)) transporter